MSAVLQVQEPSARYLPALRPGLVEHFDLVASAPGGVARLRELILTLAVRGKLVEQNPSDEPAEALVQRLAAKGHLSRHARRSVGAEARDANKPTGLPRSWRCVRLGTALEMTNGRAFKPSEWLSTGLPIVRIQNLNKEAAPFNYCDPATVDQRHKIESDDFLISWSGTPGTSFGAFIWRRGPAALNQHIFKCGLLAEIFIPEFLQIAINTQLHVLIARAQGGVGLQHVTKGALESLVLALPPKAEQARIVARVEELMRLCDALEAKGRLEDAQHVQLVDALLSTLTDSASPVELAANWQRVAANFDLLLDRRESVDALEQTVLRLAVRGLLVPEAEDDQSSRCDLKSPQVRPGRLLKESASKADGAPSPAGEQWRLPASWQRVRLADVCSLITDGEHATPERCSEATAVPLVTAKNVRSEAMDYGQTDFVPVAVAEQCWRRCKPAVGDILMVSVGATLGRLCVLQEARDMVLVRSVTVIRPIPNVVNVSYLALHLMSPDSQADIWGSVKQSAQPCLYLAKSAALNIALPPITEQSRIVGRVNELRRLCADLREKLNASQTTQGRLADALVEPPAGS